MTNRNARSYPATLSLLLIQMSLTGCLYPWEDSATESGSTTETTGGTTDDPTTGVPTTSATSGTTGEGERPPLDEKCEECGSPETVQLCYCINTDSDPAQIEKAFYGCPNDQNFVSAATAECKTLLNVIELDEKNLPCFETIMCPIQGPDPTDETCLFCGDASIVYYYCFTDMNDKVSVTPGCANNSGFEMMMKSQCAMKLGKDVEELTTLNFFTQTVPCPGFDTTGGDTTGGDTTGGDTTGGDTGEQFTDCEGWDPASEISYVDDIYYVNTSLVERLVDNPIPLIDCDNARLAPLPAGGYQLLFSSAGELLYELGLRDGDIPLYLNGYSLESTTDTIIAFGELWYLEGDTEYELIVLRAGMPTALSFSLVP